MLFPIAVFFNAAAFEVFLNDIHGIGNAFMSWLLVLFHRIIHGGLDDFPGIVFVDVNSDGHSNKTDKNQGQHRSIGVDHAGIVSASATTSAESHNQHDSSDDDQDDGSVEVSVAKEIQVLGHVDLNVGTDANQSRGSQEEDEVKQKYYALQHFVATTHLEAC